MARLGVTYQDISNAANELNGLGKSITIENIRVHLGTGSIGTINKYLRQWREIQSSTSKIVSKENIPEELVSLMKGLWDGVITQSIKRFEPVEINYQNEITDLKIELEKYRNNNERWQKLFNQWQQEKMQLANEMLTLEQALEFAHKENQSLHSKYDSVLQQLQEKQVRIEELHRLHQQTQANLEHYRESAREQFVLAQQQFEREKQQFLFDMKELKEQLIVQQRQYSIVHQEKQLLEQSHSELKVSHSKSNVLCESLNSEIQQLRNDTIEYQQTNQHRLNQINDLQTRVDANVSEVINLQGNNQFLNQQLINSKELMCDLRDQNKLLASEKWELAQEKAMVEGQLKELQKRITA